MVEVKIGMFPGRSDNYTLEDDTTVRDALKIADITVGAEQEVKMDGEVVSMDDIVDGHLLLVTKRLKGAY